MQRRKYAFGKYCVALSYIRWVFDTVCYERKENVKFAEGNFGDVGEGGRNCCGAACGRNGKGVQDSSWLLFYLVQVSTIVRQSSDAESVNEHLSLVSESIQTA